MGAKSYIAMWIVEHLPSHHCYVEVFGGTGAVLFAKTLSPYEVYNDKNDAVYNFFQALRETPEELIEYLAMFPYSRQLVWDITADVLPSETVVQKGANFFLKTMLSFSGVRSTSFPIRSGYREDGQIRKTSFATMFRNKIQALRQFAKRLSCVTIEHMDFRNLIKGYDWEGACFYCDPEYIDKSLYETGMTRKDHYKLAEILNNIKGKAIVSYYPHPILESLYPKEQWIWIEKEVVRQSVKHLKKEKATELLIMNYDPMKDKWRPRNQTALDQWSSDKDPIGGQESLLRWIQKD